MPGELFDVMSLRGSPSRSVRLPTSRSPPRTSASPDWGPSDRFGNNTKRPARFNRRSALRWAAITAVIALLLYRSFIETHVQIAFYNRGWVRDLLPPDPPPLSNRCFSPSYLSSPWSPLPDGASFPSSPGYNLSLGTLGLAPKVLSLSPGFDLPHHDDCYRFSRTLPVQPLPQMEQTLLGEETQVFHLYWRSDLAPVGERQIITLKSLLATQNFAPLQGVGRAEAAGDLTSHVILWTNPSARDLAQDPLLSPLLDGYQDRLSLKVLDIPKLTRGTAMEGHELLKDVFDKRAWLDGDLVRVLVLWHFGGYWVDMDDLVTRDLRVLGEHEWVVMWDCYDKPYEPLNGHMMHFFRHSPYLCEMLDLMSKPPTPRPASTDWGQHLYHRLYRSLISAGVTPFKVLPYCLTDGRSCTLRDRLPDPFASKQEEQGWRWPEKQWEKIEERVKGVFAIHLHNQWDKGFATDGWVRRLLVDEWDRKLGSRGG